MRRALKIILPLLVLALGVAGIWLMITFKKQVKPRPADALPPLVQTVEAKRQDYQFRVRTHGTVRPRTEIQLVAEVSGRVIEAAPAFDEGGFFQKDAVLVTVDPRDFELGVTRAEAQVAEARYKHSLEEAFAAVARKEWEDLKTGDSQREPSPLLLREPQLAQAQAALASAQAGLEQARRDLERCRIRAPFDGRVGQTFVDAGQFVSRGAAVGRIFAVDHAEVRLPLTAEQLAYVDLPLDYRGEPGTGETPAVLLRASLAGRVHTWEGRVVRTEGEIDVRTRMLSAIARVDDPYGRSRHYDRPPLASGLFVDAEILGRRVQGVIVLPRSALRGKDQVLVLDKESRLRFRGVEVLRADREEVVIRAGIEPGERICTTPLDAVVDGMKVRTVDDPPQEAPPLPGSAAMDSRSPATANLLPLHDPKAGRVIALRGPPTRPGPESAPRGERDASMPGPMAPLHAARVGAARRPYRGIPVVQGPGARPALEVRPLHEPAPCACSLPMGESIRFAERGLQTRAPLNTCQAGRLTPTHGGHVETRPSLIARGQAASAARLS